jgi:hypothetical protein
VQGRAETRRQNNGQHDNQTLGGGALVVLPVSAGNPKRGQATQHAVPDVMVYVEGSELVALPALLGAEATATRMFARIGVQVQWSDRRPGRGAEPASTGCALKRPEEIVVRMASERAGSSLREALAVARPFARTGVRVTVFYGELREVGRVQPRLEPVLLAHVLVHEITHVLQGVAQHSSTGVMRAHWTPRDYANMEERPLEFAGADADLIRLGLRRTQSPACVESPSGSPPHY